MIEEGQSQTAAARGTALCQDSRGGSETCLHESVAEGRGGRAGRAAAHFRVSRGPTQIPQVMNDKE